MQPAEMIRALIFLGLVVGVYVGEAGIWVRFVRRRMAGETGACGALHPVALLIHVLAIIGVGCMAYGYFVEPYWLGLSRVELHTPKLARASLRIVHISDLHCDPKVRNEPKLAGLINPLKPDLIVFTGDAANSREAVPLFRRTLRSLEAGLGKLAVRGNFDVGRARGWDLFEGTGFRLLESDSVVLAKAGEEFRVCGVGALCNSRGDLPAANPPRFTIYLHHYPAMVEEVSGPGVDLYLCGHTHGGQVALPFYGAIVTLSRTGKKYESGFYRVGPTAMYVSRGVGMEGGVAPRVRFCARPEVTLIDVRPAAGE
jgi:hypothetical protein